MPDAFTRTYADRTYRHTTMLRHGGAVIAFAMDDRQRIVYGVLDPTKGPTDAAGWPATPEELPFVAELAHVGFGAADQDPIPQVALGSTTAAPAGTTLRPEERDPFLSSTARFTADAPFQVLSDGVHVYVFRQSITADDTSGRMVRIPPGPTGTPMVDGTLLVDRFLLVGPELQATREVRFQRSRSRTRPASAKDGLGATDLEKQPFFEPTQALDFLGSVTGGFTVVVIPTGVTEVSRWQFAVAVGSGGPDGADRVDLVGVERSAEGLFDTRGTEFFTCPNHPSTFSLSPGTCPAPDVTDPTTTCGRELVPAAERTGYAGSALSFAEDGDRLDLTPPVPLGATWTVEAWLSPAAPDSTATGGDQPEDRLLLGSGGTGPADGPSVWISQGTRVRAGCSVGGVWTETTSGDVLTPDAWQHLAVTSDSSRFRVYRDGDLVHRGDPATGTPTTGSLATVGGTAGFRGVLDELRVWAVTRAARDLQQQMSRRLIGLEPGLVAYLRLDEAEGPRVYDAVPAPAGSSARTGALQGPAWVTSKAPIADSVGITRSSVVLAGRRLASGPSSLLYHQQEAGAAGYSPDAKPLKLAARYLLAFGTRDSNTSDPTAPDQPARVAALDLGVGADGKPAELPASIALPIRTATTDGGAGTPDAQLARLSALEAQASAWRDEIASDTPQLDALQAAVAYLDRYDAAGGILAEDPPPLTAAEVMAARSARNAMNVALGRLNDLINAQAPAAAIAAAQIAYNVTAAQSEAASASLENHHTALRQQFDALTAELLDVSQQLAAATTEIATLRASLGGTATATMPLLRVDPRGRTVTGAVLDFARTGSAPRLFESARSQVAMYFADDSSRLSVAHYDTTTDRTRFTLRAATGVLGLLARSPDLTRPVEQDALAVEVTPAGTTLTLTITLSSGTAAPVQEVWQNLPRDAARFADVVNGRAAVPQPLGPLAGSLLDLAGGGTASISLTTPLASPLAAGTVLVVGGARLRLSADVPAGTSRLPVDSVPSDLPAATIVFAVAYDYATLASSSTVGADLSGGSRLLVADATGAVGDLTDDPPVAIDASSSCRWFASPPGTSLDLDGRTTVAAPPPGADLTRFTTAGDLTVEAWVRPFDTLAPATIVSVDPGGAAGGTPYSLSLRPTANGHAVRLDGARAWIRLSGVTFPGAGPLTMEAWVQPATMSGLQTVVAHGTAVGAPELTLRLVGATYQFGVWDGSSNHFAIGPDRSADIGSWVHLAGTWDGTTYRLYRNGALEAEHADPVGPQVVTGSWTAGAAAPGTDRLLTGGLDQIRIWTRARSATELLATRDTAVPASPDLAAVVTFFDLRGRAGLGGTVSAEMPGDPPSIPSALPNLVPVARVGGRQVVGTDPLPNTWWTHLAMAYTQRHGLALTADAYLDCGNSPTLDLGSDLTIEVGVRLDDLATGHGLLSRGRLGDPDQDSPYDFAVTADGRLRFTFQTSSHDVATAIQSDAQLNAGTFACVAVTRERHQTTTAPANDPGKPVLPPTTTVSYTITFYVNGAPAGSGTYTVDKDHADIGSSSSNTAIGMAWTGAPGRLRGRISEVRVWSVARPAGAVGTDIKGREEGLVSWWRCDENTGGTTADSKSTNTATFTGAVTWVPTPDPAGSGLVLFRDGETVPTTSEQPPAAAPSPASGHVLVGAAGAAGAPTDLLQGQLAELRVWATTRTAEQIEDSLFRRLTGEREDLLAYYRFDPSADGTLGDSGPRGNVLTAGGAPVPASPLPTALSTAPLSDDVPQVRNAMLPTPSDRVAAVDSEPDVVEYADLQTDATGNMIGVFKRAYAAVTAGRWELVTGFKVGDMVTEWVGQAQFDPQIVGYMEGAPPVPSENLTVQDSYTDASTVALTDAATTTYTYSANRDTGFDTALEASVMFGSEGEVLGGIGLATLVGAWKIMGGVKSSFETHLGWLDEATSKQGRALTAVSTLGLRGHKEATPAHAALGNRFVPQNTGFALVQSQTADVYALRLKDTGALIAYQMLPNPDIPRDWNILTFPLNPTYTKQGTLDGKVGLEPDADYPNALAGGSDLSYYKPIEAYALKTQIDREEQRLGTLFDQFDAGAVGRRQSGANFSDQDLAAGGIIDRLPNLDKRNLVNTYVWTADGGQYAEQEQTLDTREETTGGSYAFLGQVGGVGTIKTVVGDVGIQVDLSALFGGHLNLTVNKSRSSDTSFGAAVTVAPESDLSGTVNGAATLRKEGKVDAYRFMTFYLQPTSDNFDEFFGRVVDPVWLSEGSPAATALQAARQSSTRPPCWRVLHRVTFVSRVLPALSNEPGTIGSALHELDIDSNYELIRTLEPFVRDKAGSFATFDAAVRAAVARYLPVLVPHVDDVVAFLVLYYGVSDAPGLAPAAAEDTSHLVPPPATVLVTGETAVTMPSGGSASATISGSVVDETYDQGAFLLAWSTVTGPADAVFTAATSASTTVSFPAPGVYRLRLTATAAGRAASHRDLVVTVSGAPAGTPTPVGTPG